MLQRHIAPPFVKTNSLDLPHPIVMNLNSNTNLFVIAGVKQNVCKVELILQAGKWFENKVGLSNFTSALLEKGTLKKTSSEIAEIFDNCGAHLEINPGYDSISISLITVKDHLPKLLPLLQEILLAPSFPQTEWNLVKDIFLQNLKISNEKTSAVASKLIRKNVFGAGHPYGTSIQEADVEALSVSDFSAYYRANFKIKSIFICGDLKPAEIDFIGTGFASLFSTHASEAPSMQQNVVPFKQHVEKENIQSSIRLAKKSLLKTHPHYFGLLLVNHLLGGFFGSRLMKNIREDKGLTYGIHSSLVTFQKDSMFVIEADVNKANLELALAEIKNEIKRLSTHLVGGEELTLAKNHFIGSLQTELANPFSVAEKIKNIELNALGHNFYQRLIHQIEIITPQEFQSLSQRYFQEESIFEVTVG